MPNVSTVISIVLCVGSALLLHLDFILPIVDATFPAPKLPEVMVRSVPEKPHCIWPVLVTALLCRWNECVNSESTETGAAYVDLSPG